MDNIMNPSKSFLQTELSSCFHASPAYYMLLSHPIILVAFSRFTASCHYLSHTMVHKPGHGVQSGLKSAKQKGIMTSFGPRMRLTHIWDSHWFSAGSEWHSLPQGLAPVQQDPHIHFWKAEYPFQVLPCSSSPRALRRPTCPLYFCFE